MKLSNALALTYALVGCALLLSLGCPPATPPGPMPPDATDGAPSPSSLDGGVSCASACARLSELGCDAGSAMLCVAKLTQEEGARLVRLHDGGALRCADIALARSPADLSWLGITCGRP